MILVMTVGMGHEARRVDTLYASMRKSMGEGEWERVVLLPSFDTAARAQELISYVEQLAPGGFAIEVSAPLQPEEHDREDQCFFRFDGVLSRLIEQGTSPDGIVFDYTRGTKAMSAAAVLACVSRGVERIRYVTGLRGPDGQVIPGSERILDGSTTEAVFQRELDRSRLLFRTGQFEAARQTLARLSTPANTGPADSQAEPKFRKLLREHEHNEVDCGLALANFWGAWDRFHYIQAKQSLASLPKKIHSSWAGLEPSQENAKMIKKLAVNPEPRPAASANLDTHRVYAKALVPAHRRLVADLLQNAWRRWCRGDLEDTLIRAFRAQELLGHLRLCKKGILASALYMKDPDLQSWMQTKDPKSGKPYVLHRNELAQPMACKLLDHLGDPFGEELAREDLSELKRRKKSLLTHGLRSQAAEPKSLADLLNKLEELFLKDEFGNLALLQAARFPVPIIEKEQ